MKKFIVGLMLAFISILNVNAQIYDAGTINDNWYVGGGIGTQIWNDVNSWKTFTPINKQQLNLNIMGGKYFTPYIGAELDATAVFNSGVEHNFVDGHLISLNGVVNLSNIVCGYTGQRRPFEVELIAGSGWYHTYQCGKDFNHSALRGAIRGNIKVSKDLNVFIMPEYVSITKVNDHFKMYPQGVNIYAGVKWNIPSKRGNFPVCQLRDETEIAVLNGIIEDLQNHPRIVEKIVVNTIDNSYDVYFGKGNAEVGDVSSIAEALNKSNASITIIGGISPEGSETYNRNLAIARANALKEALVKAGVAANRITVTSGYDQQRRATIILNK